MIEELDSVILTEELPEHHLKPGDIGTVVLIHGEHAGYEVEFVTLDGDTIAVVSVYPSQIRAVKSGEIAHVRSLETT
ncbi:MAG: DUF4926 domain-containing protein [Chloroflexi bacterium]|nr:MAG: DUF4926 domain-containing protein [Chloroflexota bacterium]